MKKVKKEVKRKISKKIKKKETDKKELAAKKEIDKKEIKMKKLRGEVEKEAKEMVIQKKTKTREEREKKKILVLTGILFGMIVTAVLIFLNKTLALSFVSFFVVSGLFFLYFYLRNKLREAGKIKKIESAFPDFLQLMASNLRAGMTIDKAMLISSRPEFAPLDKEILIVGKDIATGRDIEAALLDMSKRIKSEKISKTVLLIISGIRAGGNLAILLEETATNMRERSFVEKRAASSVLMYVIFIFLASSVGAPVLFSLSSVLVETLTNLLSGIPAVETSMNVPFTLSSVNISVNFIKYFSLVFIIVTNILASLVLGLVSKGEEREGLKYLIPMLAISIIIFFAIRFSLSGVLAGLFA